MVIQTVYNEINIVLLIKTNVKESCSIVQWVRVERDSAVVGRRLAKERRESPQA